MSIKFQELFRYESCNQENVMSDRCYKNCTMLTNFNHHNENKIKREEVFKHIFIDWDIEHLRFVRENDEEIDVYVHLATCYSHGSV